MALCPHGNLYCLSLLLLVRIFQKEVLNSIKLSRDIFMCLNHTGYFAAITQQIFCRHSTQRVHKAMPKDNHQPLTCFWSQKFSYATKHNRPFLVRESTKHIGTTRERPISTQLNLYCSFAIFLVHNPRHTEVPASVRNIKIVHSF